MLEITGLERFNLSRWGAWYDIGDFALWEQLPPGGSRGVG